MMNLAKPFLLHGKANNQKNNQRNSAPMNQDANTNPFTQIGLIARSHGLKGELKVLFENEDPIALEELNMVYLRNERGDYFPARVREIRCQEKGNKFSFFVQFEHIADRASAEALRNRGIFLETEKAEEFLTAYEPEDSVLNYDVYDSNNQHFGIITDILENLAQDTLVIAGKSGTILVPFVDQFVVSIDDENEAVICQNLDLLEGL